MPNYWPIGGGSGGGVTSFNTRTGAVVPVAGDYTAAMITNAVDQTQTYANPPWISSLAWSKITGAPSFGPAGSNTQVQYNNGGVFGADAGLTWSSLNLAIQGSGLFNPTLFLAAAGGTATPIVSMLNNGGPSCLLNANVYSGSGGNGALQIQVLSSRGSASVPAATQAGDYFLLFVLSGYSGSSNQRAAVINVVAENNWTPSATPAYISFSTSPAASTQERMRITSAGRIGIGTISPGYLLDVAGDCNLSAGSVYRINGVPLATGQPQTPWAQNIDGAGFNLGNVSNIGIGIAATTTPLWISQNSATNTIYASNANSAGSAVIALANSGGNTLYIGSAGSASTTYPASTCFLSFQNPLVFASGGVELMRITTGGLVGIGTASPGCTLDCAGFIRANGGSNPTSGVGLNLTYQGGSGFINVYDFTGAAYKPLQIAGSPVTINGSGPPSQGFVGIWTVSPAYPLTVTYSAANTTSVLAVENRTTGIYGAGIVFRATDSATAAVYSAGRIYGVFDSATFSQGRVTIQCVTGNDVFADVLSIKNGLVGIGTVSPQTTLDVNGMVRSVGLPVTPSTGAGLELAYGAPTCFISGYDRGAAAWKNISMNGLQIWLNPTSAGNVGIGTNNPTYLLTLAADSASKPSTSTWTILSDGRVKGNVRDLEGGLDIIAALRPVEAEYNGAAGTAAGARVVSFLAEDVRKILPHCISSHRGKLLSGEETDILDLNIHEILMHLVLAVQQLEKQYVEFYRSDSARNGVKLRPVGAVNGRSHVPGAGEGGLS